VQPAKPAAGRSAPRRGSARSAGPLGARSAPVSAHTALVSARTALVSACTALGLLALLPSCQLWTPHGQTAAAQAGSAHAARTPSSRADGVQAATSPHADGQSEAAAPLLEGRTAPETQLPSAEPPPLEPYDAEASGDREAGVAHLSKLLRRMRQALEAKDFPEAERLLASAQRGVAHSSPLTTSHPDFEDVSDAVQQGRKLLNAAVEAHRLAERAAAIDALITAQQETRSDSLALLQTLISTSPDPETLVRGKKLSAAQRQLAARGEIYRAEPRYAEVAAACTATQQALDRGLLQAQRTLESLALVGPAVESGVAAVRLALAAPQATARQLQYQTAAGHFTHCAQDLHQQSLLPDADPHRLLQTRLGLLSAETLEARCQQLAERSTVQAKIAAWQLQVMAQVDLVAAALDAARHAPDAQAAETRAAQAAGVLQACEDAEVLSTRGVGPHATQRFETPFGSLTAAALAQRCGLEAHALRAQGPTLHWRTLTLSLMARLFQVDRQLKDAAAQAQPAPRAAATAAAVGGLQECLERSTVLRHTPGAEANTEFETPWGIVTLRKLTGLCLAQKRAAEQALRTLKSALTPEDPPLEPIPIAAPSP
jgi:hypothetical protein